MEVETGKSRVVADDEAAEPTWIGVDNLFVLLKAEEDGKMTLMVRDATDLSK